MKRCTVCMRTDCTESMHPGFEPKVKRYTLTVHEIDDSTPDEPKQGKEVCFFQFDATFTSDTVNDWLSDLALQHILIKCSECGGRYQKHPTLDYVQCVDCKWRPLSGPLSPYI